MLSMSKIQWEYHLIVEALEYLHYLEGAHHLKLRIVEIMRDLRMERSIIILET